MWKFAFAISVFSQPAFACKLALILSIDVSNSVDRFEYRYQVDGLADALLDVEIAHVLTRDDVMLSVVQWSGPDQQASVLPWRQMHSNEDVEQFSAEARNMRRAFLFSKTALGNALAYSIAQFNDVPECERRVIDVSGDGVANLGINVAQQRNIAQVLGIEINGVAIDYTGRAVTQYYQYELITESGFVLTSRGFDDYPRTIRAKIFKELIKPGS